MSDFYSKMEETGGDRDRWYWLNHRRYDVGYAKLTAREIITFLFLAVFLLAGARLLILGATRSDLIAMATVLGSWGISTFLAAHILVRKFGPQLMPPYARSFWSMDDDEQLPIVLLSVAGPLTNFAVALVTLTYGINSLEPIWLQIATFNFWFALLLMLPIPGTPGDIVLTYFVGAFTTQQNYYKNVGLFWFGILLISIIMFVFNQPNGFLVIGNGEDGLRIEPLPPRWDPELLFRIAFVSGAGLGAASNAFEQSKEPTTFDNNAIVPTRYYRMLHRLVGISEHPELSKRSDTT